MAIRWPKWGLHHVPFLLSSKMINEQNLGVGLRYGFSMVFLWTWRIYTIPTRFWTIGWSGNLKTSPADPKKTDGQSPKCLVASTEQPYLSSRLSIQCLLHPDAEVFMFTAHPIRTSVMGCLAQKNLAMSGKGMKRQHDSVDLSGWWLTGTCFVFSILVGGNFIIPTDDLKPSFFRG